MKGKLRGKQTFLDDKHKEIVVSYYLMEEEGDGVYGVAVEKRQKGSDVVEWDAVPKLSASMELAERVLQSLIRNKVTPISFAESLDEIMIREERNGQSEI